VVCKGKVITVFVREYFPHERYVLGLAEQQDSRSVEFLHAGEEVPQGKVRMEHTSLTHGSISSTEYNFWFLCGTRRVAK
jgi:hypothetical protein